MGDQPAFDFADGEDSGGGAVEAPSQADTFLLPTRQQHPFPPDGNNRTCYFCHMLCHEVSDRFYYTDTKGYFCCCETHKNFVGRHGELADPKRKPRDPGSVARYIRTSTAPSARQRGRKADRPKPITVNPGEELEVGEVSPEVAAFLRAKGKM